MSVQTVDIKGYEGKYQVTSDGKVLSLPNISRKGIRELKPDICKHKHTSYKRVTLCKNGKIKRYMVHQLVAQAFVLNPDNKPHVNHIDNNGLHNFDTNLEWTTPEENMRHSAKQGRQDECRLLGIKAASKKARQLTLNKMKQLMGTRLIKVEYKNPRRCFITFHCKHCGNIYTKRADTPAIKRAGICRECIKR